MRTTSSTPLRKGLALSLASALMLMGLPLPALAQSGGTATNGQVTNAQFGPPFVGFLFEPEVPLASLKTVPTWNELEQLLDNPYRVTLCSNLGLNVPGTTQIPGSPTAVIPFPSYCSNGVERRPGFGVTLPPFLVHPLNYNPTTGEEMRLLNPGFPQTRWKVPDQLVQNFAVDPTGNTWVWTYRDVVVSPGEGRVEEAEIDYNAPIQPDIAGLPGPANVQPPLNRLTCITTTEAVPPEGSIICGGDTGEPRFAGFGVPNAQGYSTPAVPNVPTSMSDAAGFRLFDPTGRGFINPRNATTGAGGLRKPSLRIPPYGNSEVPGFRVNTDPDNVAPSNENDYVLNRNMAAVLGKALFWDQQVGSDTVQACGSCHVHAGADNRTKNQINPNHLGPEGFLATFDVRQPNEDLVAGDFPFLKLANPDMAGDPRCGNVVATVAPGVLENAPTSDPVVCSSTNVVSDKNNANPGGVANDVASSMGVHFGLFRDIPPIGTGAGQSFGPASSGVKSLLPDVRSANPADNVDPIPGFRGEDGSGHGVRRVEPRNTPTIFAAALNFDNFWDGRARHDFNGGSVFGAADPQKHVFVAANSNGHGPLIATRQIIRFVSLASLATGPALSEFEMSLQGRNWAKIGKKLLQDGVTPLANQLVDPTDSVLGPFSNQNGSACAGLPAADRSPGTPAAGKPGLCISYPSLIRRAFRHPLWDAAQGFHLNGCYTQGGAAGDPIRPSCAAGTPDDPFDHYVLSIANAPAQTTNTNQFTQLEGNFSLFFGLSLQVWASLLMPDDTPFDQFLDGNPDMFESIGESIEPGLVGPVVACTTPGQVHCFTPRGNFKRDASLDCDHLPAGGEGGGTVSLPDLACRGPVGQRRQPGETDPLLGMDIFQGSNYSLKNPNFRAARCGECHAGATLTDNTVPFTFKAQLGDFIGEFSTPGTEALVEPLGRTRVISGFLLESEFNENGQDAVERRIINQSIVPNPADGIAYPDALVGPDGVINPQPTTGSGQAFFDNGVYNLGVTRCEADQSGVTGVCDDIGRGGTDAFGWPLSLAALLLKNMGGHAGGQPCTLNGNSMGDCDTEPGQPLMTYDPFEEGGGALEESAQDQQINPGVGDDLISPALPPHLAPWANNVPVGDAMPELDELHGGFNTLTDTPMLEGFIDTLGPFNPAGVLNESYNNGIGPTENADGTPTSRDMGTWPFVNRVGRMGSFKAPQLREVGLTGPYFHNGGKLTLRQVVDFYVRGGDFPVTNAAHRDFNIVNQNFEAQSNLTEHEKAALVDFLLELTDERVRRERGPFDHPEAIIPLDGRAPENTLGRGAMLASCTTAHPAAALSPGARVCAGGMFLHIPAVGNGGNSSPLPNFLGISNARLEGAAANCGPAATSQYCH